MLQPADLKAIVLAVFVMVRRRLGLGVSELLAALHITDPGGPAENEEDVRALVRLIWCHSSEAVREFDNAWERVQIVSPPQAGSINVLPPSIGNVDWSVTTPQPVDSQQDIFQEEAPTPPEPKFAPAAVKVPFQPAWLGASNLESYSPLSRRNMIYLWRYLRKPVPDGPPVILDIQATVEQAARQGFFLSPVYKRKEYNHAHLLLLLDQGGSMVPFHRVTRDLAQTAECESTLRDVQVFYFHNTATSTLYADAYRTQPIPLETALAACSVDSSVLIVSDAGAARGYRRLERISATAEFLAAAAARGTSVAWLNPMPRERWTGTSAQLIAQVVQMFQMDSDGFSSAIDVLRGG